MLHLLTIQGNGSLTGVCYVLSDIVADIFASKPSFCSNLMASEAEESSCLVQ